MIDYLKNPTEEQERTKRLCLKVFLLLCFEQALEKRKSERHISLFIITCLSLGNLIYL